MLRIVPALAVLVFASIASAQVIFHPPERIERPIYPPAKAMEIARSIHWPDCIVIIQDAEGRPVRVLHGPPAQLQQPLIEEGLDPETGRPLHFRKRDLLTQPGDGSVEFVRPPANSAPPAGAAPQSPPDRGRILIKPYRENRAGSLVSR